MAPNLPSARAEGRTAQQRNLNAPDEDCRWTLKSPFVSPECESVSRRIRWCVPPWTIPHIGHRLNRQMMQFGGGTTGRMLRKFSIGSGILP